MKRKINQYSGSRRENISQSQLPAGAKACHPVNLVITLVKGSPKCTDSPQFHI